MNKPIILSEMHQVTLSIDFFKLEYTHSMNRSVLIISSIECFLSQYCRGWSQWPRGLRCRSTAARLLRSWIRFPPGAWMSVCCESNVLSGTGLCDELITCPEESYQLWCVAVCGQETS
jgi:hypothetical protein